MKMPNCRLKKKKLPDRNKHTGATITTSTAVAAAAAAMVPLNDGNDDNNDNHPTTLISKDLAFNYHHRHKHDHHHHHLQAHFSNKAKKK